MMLGSNFSEISNILNNAAQQVGGPTGDVFSRAGSSLGPLLQTFRDRKGKGAPQQPPQMQVPQANSGFYQPSNTDARSQLLQAMMQRSRAGRQMGA